MAFTHRDPNSTDRGGSMTNEEKKATIAALVEERRGYVARGEDSRVAEVDEQLRRLGAGARTGAQRGTRRGSGRRGA